MHHFHRKNGTLHAEETSLVALAQAVGTPFYCYAQATLLRHYRVFKEAVSSINASVFFAVKANSNQSVLRLLAQCGAGADTVSLGEIKRAIAAGFLPERIIFSGVGKSDDELNGAIDAQLYQFNVETLDELVRLNARAEAKGLVAPVAFRFNPDVDAEGNPKVRTGSRYDKFGLDRNQIDQAIGQLHTLKHIQLVGLACHIGSQIDNLETFAKAMSALRDLYLDLRRRGLKVHRIDVGGGLGVPFDRAADAPPSPKRYGALLAKVFAGVEAEYATEPGRLIAGNAGVLVARVLTRQEREGKTFVIVDAAMNDLLRPTLYGAHHEIETVQAPREDYERADIVGPICESGDFLAEDRTVPRLEADDLIAIMTSGAYGAVMASTYNSRPLVPEVLVDGARWSLVREREPVEALILREPIAPWLL